MHHDSPSVPAHPRPTMPHSVSHTAPFPLAPLHQPELFILGSWAQMSYKLEETEAVMILSIKNKLHHPQYHELSSAYAIIVSFVF